MTTDNLPTGSYRLLSRLLIGMAILAGLMSLVPRDWVVPIGPLVGRPNAVTVEVHHRMVIVCGVFAVVLAIGGAALARWPYQIHSLRSELLQGRQRWRLPWSDSWKFVLPITLVGAAIRCVHLTVPMAYDESYTFLNYARKSFVECIADYDSTNNHLLNSWVMHWLYRVGGPHEVVLRLGVVLAGILLIPATYVWAREWSDRATAALAAVLVAIAPALITYSVDARGYAYMTLSAVCLDLAMRRQRAGTEFPRHWAIVGIASAVLGLWAMPIMLYAVLGSAASYLGIWGLRSRSSEPSLRSRLVSWGWHAALVGLLVFLLYTPAFVYRGLRFLHDPIMRPTQSESFLTATFTSWQGAWEWWTAGVLPSIAWGVLVFVGLLAWTRERIDRFTWLCPFLAVALVNLFKSSAPPPRIYLWLLPWIALAAAEGATVLARWCRCPKWGVTVLVATLLSFGTICAMRAPVLIHAEERLFFLDVPAVVAAVHDDLKNFPNRPARLMSPLPVDYPTRFYLERQQSRVVMNGPPQSGEVVYAIVFEGDSLTDTFCRSPIGLPDWPVDSVAWTPVPVPPLVHHSGKLRLVRTQLP
jgi:hypothetical protein